MERKKERVKQTIDGYAVKKERKKERRLMQ